MTLNTEAEFFCTMISWILDNPNNEYKWSKILHDKLNQVETHLSEENIIIFYTYKILILIIKKLIIIYN